MSLVNPYCTVDSVKAELGNRDAAVVGWLEDCITAASRYIDEWRGRDYFQHDHTSSPLVIRGALHRWLDKSKLTLPYSPIIGTLTSVTEGGVTLVAETDYVIVRGADDMEDDALVRIGGEWLMGYTSTDAIAISGKFGYAQVNSGLVPTGIPAHITKAAVLITAAFSTLDQKEIISADGMRDRIATKSLPPQVGTLLGPKARRVLA